MTTIVLTNRLLFGPLPAGETATRLTFASLESPPDDESLDSGMHGARGYPHRDLDDDRFARPRPEIDRHHHRPHAPDTGHHHRPHAPEPDHHHRPHDLTAGHHHRPHEKAPADEFLTKYDRRLTNSPSEKETAARRVYTPGDEHIPLSGGAASRRDSLSGMKPEFRARLGAMFRDAPPGSSVFSGYRSPALQAKLYREPHRPGYVARPGHSHHGMGDAADIKGNLAWFHKHAAEYGLRFPMAFENWHIQSAPGTKVPVPGGIARSKNLADAGPPVPPELAPTRKADK